MFLIITITKGNVHHTSTLPEQKCCFSAYPFFVQFCFTVSTSLATLNIYSTGAFENIVPLHSIGTGDAICRTSPSEATGLADTANCRRVLGTLKCHA